MNLEELTKSQVVLLTLLVSFVTSIATGIVTVSLAEQGVSPVTNTVNRIVERTKEVVVKVESPEDPQVVTKEVVIREGDLVAKAIEQNKNVSIAIYKSVTAEVSATENTETIANDEETERGVDTDTPAPETQVATPTKAIGDGDTQSQGTDLPATETKLVFVARGIFVGDGLIATDASMLDKDQTEYIIITNDERHLPATVKLESNGIAILSASANITPEFADADSLEHGQVVIVLSGTDRMRVVKTIIAEILTQAGEVVAVDTNASNISPGSALINLDGEVVGISTGVSRESGKAWFTTVNQIKTILNQLDSAQE